MLSFFLCLLHRSNRTRHSRISRRIRISSIFSCLVSSPILLFSFIHHCMRLCFRLCFSLTSYLPLLLLVLLLMLSRFLFLHFSMIPIAMWAMSSSPSSASSQILFRASSFSSILNGSSSSSSSWNALSDAQPKLSSLSVGVNLCVWALDDGKIRLIIIPIHLHHLFPLFDSLLSNTTYGFLEAVGDAARCSFFLSLSFFSCHTWTCA